MAASTSTSMPASKKRCWVLMFNDIQNTNVKEAEVLSSFRKRYTSVKNLAFRSPATYEDGLFQEITNDDKKDGSTACVEVQFTGPQPIEGPAGLLCTLLQGAFAGAHPVQLGRGRKRKVRSGAGGVATSPSAFSPASVVGGDACSKDPRSFLSGRHDGFASSGNFDFRFQRDDNASSSSGSGSSVDDNSDAVKKGAATTGYDSSGDSTITTASDTASDTASTYSHLSRASSSSSSTTSLEDFFDGLLEDEDGVGSASAAAAPIRPAKRLSLSGPAGRHSGRVSNETTPSDSAPSPPVAAHQLGRSGSVISVATEDLPKWDDVVRCVDSPSSSSSCCSSSTSSLSPSSSSGDGHRWPSLDSFGENSNPVVAGTANTTPGAAGSSASLPASNPGLTAGKSYYECKENVMSQEEAVSLFAGAASATTTVAATAAGGVVVSEDGLWDMPPDDADTLFIAPLLERHTSSSWGLVHTDAATVVDNDNADDDADDGDDAKKPNGCDPRSVSRAATSVVERHQQQQRQRESCASAVDDDRFKLPSRGHQISFGWCEEECDFDGRSSTFPRRGGETPTSTTSSPPLKPASVGSQCLLTFQGLQGAVQECDLRDLTVRAKFSLDSERASTVDRVAKPLKVDARGHAHAAVTYPSMLEIWPEVYGVSSVRVIEVDMVVEIRSRDGTFVYTGPTLKVNYRRPATRMFVSTIPMSRQTARISSAHASAGPAPAASAPGTSQ